MSLSTENERQKAKGKKAPDTVKRKLPTIYSSSSEEEDQPSTSQSKKIKTNEALQFLIHEELQSDTSDESFNQGNISSESEIIPSTPLKTHSIMQGKFDEKIHLKMLKIRDAQNQGKTRLLHQNKTIQKFKMTRNFLKKMNPSGKNILAKTTMKSGKARAATLRWK